MGLKWPAKDPDEVLDYKVDWSKRLGADTIASSTWPVVPSGITLLTSTNQPKSTTAWLSGGTEGQTYSLVNRITTASGRVMEQTVDLPIKSR